MHNFAKFIVVLIFSLSGCVHSQYLSIAENDNESVMCEGMAIAATYNTGTIIIKAGREFERFYICEGETRSQKLKPREKRWAGRLGIGFSKDNVWKSHNTITNVDLEEAQVHFKSIDEAMRFVRHRTRLDGNTVYNDTGLVVTWNKAIHPEKKEGNVMMVDVWQVLVNGVKPSKLEGSQNNKLLISNACQ